MKEKNKQIYLKRRTIISASYQCGLMPAATLACDHCVNWTSCSLKTVKDALFTNDLST
jgi:hypothetical protein